MCVNLRRCQALVSQQFLNAVELCPTVEHDAGKGVAQHVRTELAGPSGGLQRVVDDMIDQGGVQRAALDGDQQVVALGPNGGAQ